MSHLLEQRSVMNAVVSAFRFRGVRMTINHHVKVFVRLPSLRQWGEAVVRLRPRLDNRDQGEQGNHNCYKNGVIPIHCCVLKISTQVLSKKHSGLVAAAFVNRSALESPRTSLGTTRVVANDDEHRNKNHESLINFQTIFLHEFSKTKDMHELGPTFSTLLSLPI